MLRPFLACRGIFKLQFFLLSRAEFGHHARMFHGYASAHVANILLHILVGTLALLAGLLAILSRKGGRLHVRSGRLFIYAYVVIVITAVLGIVVFEFRSFLAVATIASAYDVFAGYRALRLRGRRPQLPDILAAALAFMAPGIFIFAMQALHKPWSPGLTWSVLGGIFLLSVYDLARIWLPIRWLQRAWLREHLYKMLAAYIAITATAAATIFPHLQPWSALVPVILGETATLGFLIFTPRLHQPALKTK
jgi:uncharacterized membrane protein